MHFRHVMAGLLAAFLCASGVGCKKSAPDLSFVPLTKSTPETIAHIHWLGKKRIGLAAGAYFLTCIWELPQSAQLEAQTLDKLSIASTKLFSVQSGATNLSAALLRPLLNDLVQEESYLDIRQSANGSAETVFAIRLDGAQADYWRTNLAVAMELLTGAPAVATPGGSGWSLKKSTAPDLVELTRAGQWTLVGLAQNTNSLLAQVADHARRDHSGFTIVGTNYWLEADVDPARTVRALELDWKLPPNLPRVSLGINGDGGTVFTRARLTFPESLAGQLALWDIPTDLIRGPLTGFTAVRGIKSLLAGCKWWTYLEINPPPDQCYSWSLAGSPFQLYLAFPLPDARRQVESLSERLLQNANPWLADHGYISLDRAADSNGVTWGNLASMQPFIKYAKDDQKDWLFAGLLPAAGTDANLSPSNGMIQDILSRTNLLYYDWERTGSQVLSWFDLGQTARQILRLPQLPMNSVSADWLGTIEPRLGVSTTTATLTAPNEISLVRRSTVGLTGAELQLFTDWLESPQFPHGLYSLDASTGQAPAP